MKNGYIPWSKRLKNSLLLASNQVVFVLVEDFVLRSRLNPEMFGSLISLITNEKEIDHIRLLSTMEKTSVRKTVYPLLDEIEKGASLRFLFLPGLWKREVLLQYLTDHESPFLSERMGNLKSKIFNHRFYAVSYDFVCKHGQFYDCPTSGTIFKGKWANWVPDFFNKEGIDIDFKIRGFTTKEFRKSSRIKSKLEILKSPKVALKSLFSLFNVFLKETIKVT